MRQNFSLDFRSGLSRSTFASETLLVYVVVLSEIEFACGGMLEPPVFYNGTLPALKLNL